jgi:hypothetical protein
MRYKCLTLSVIVICFLGIFVQMVDAQEKGAGKINWMEGYVSAVGEGTSNPSGNKMKDQLRATRAATLMAQRALLETVKGVRIDSQTKVENRMAQEDIISTRIEGIIQGAEIVKQDVRWEGDTPIAKVELRICIGGLGACIPEKSMINALALDQKNEPPQIPQQRLNDIIVKQETPIQKVQGIHYDSSKPVTGVIFNLQGLFFERQILPVVITIDDGNKPFTVYSVKTVDPQTIRTYGVVRYADSVEQAKQNSYLGDNVVIVPVSGVTKENMIVIGFDAARILQETTSHGNDYLKTAKVMIAAK